MNRRAARTTTKTGRHLALLMTFVPLFVLSSAGAQTCTLDIELEGVADATNLAAKIREDAQRGGACTRKWKLRISPAPKGQFIVALWDGASLETRWAANQKELELTTAMLIRTVVERSPAQPAASDSATVATPSGSGSAGSDAPTANTAPSSSATAPALTEEPTNALEKKTMISPLAGLFFGASAGVGAGGGVHVSHDIGRFEIGIAPLFGWTTSHGNSHTSLMVPVIGSYLFAPTEKVRFGPTIFAGITQEMASGTSNGATATRKQFGAMVGAGPTLLWAINATLVFHLAAPIWYSTATRNGIGQYDANRAVTTTNTTQNPGNSNGNGVGNGNGNGSANANSNASANNGSNGTSTTTTTTYPPLTENERAANDATEHLGGLQGAVLIGIGLRF